MSEPGRSCCALGREPRRPRALADSPRRARQGAARSPLAWPRRRREPRPYCSRTGVMPPPMSAEAAPPAEAGRMRAAPWPRTLPGSGTLGRPMRGRAPPAKPPGEGRVPVGHRPRDMADRRQAARAAAAVPRAVRHGLPRAGHEPGRRRRREPDRPRAGRAPGRGRRRAPGRPPCQGHLPSAPLPAFLKKIRKREKEEGEMDRVRVLSSLFIWGQSESGPSIVMNVHNWLGRSGRPMKDDFGLITHLGWTVHIICVKKRWPEVHYNTKYMVRSSWNMCGLKSTIFLLLLLLLLTASKFYVFTPLKGIQKITSGK